MAWPGVGAFQIAGNRQDFAAGEVSDLPGRLLQVSLGAATNHHLRSFLRQDLGAGPSQTLTGSADDNNFVFKF